MNARLARLLVRRATHDLPIERVAAIAGAQLPPFDNLDPATRPRSSLVYLRDALCIRIAHRVYRGEITIKARP